MPSSLPRSTPADQQVDPAAILAFLDAMDSRPDIEMHSLMVVRHGHVVAEGWWAPYSAERPHLLYSLSKSFTSTAAAFAQAEGLLDLDDAVVDHFPEFAGEITDPRTRSVKIRHVAAMASGHNREMLPEAVARDRDEPVRGFLLIPPDREPGTVFAYSQPCTYTLASIVQRNAGMPLTRYLRSRLFDPLGIGHVGWHTFPPGREQGFSGLHARTEDIAKLGLLYLQRGQWEGAELIGEKWVAEATSQQVLDAMWTHLLPGLGTVAAGTASPGAGSAGDRLSARLARLELPASPGGAAPADWEPWITGPFAVAADPRGPAGAPVQPFLTSVEVAPRDGGWQISLVEPANALTVPVGAGAWAVSDHADRHGETIPVAASGGWLDDRTLRAEIIFLETPHRMDITCSLPGRSAEAGWRHPPLSPSKLQHLHCPA
jgi:CubicO group peptidase (beta-lactamase class C family)